MAFTTDEFPNKVFDGFEEYEAYKELQHKIREEIKRKARKHPRKVKISGLLKKSDPLYKKLIRCILRSKKA